MFTCWECLMGWHSVLDDLEVPKSKSQHSPASSLHGLSLSSHEKKWGPGRGAEWNNLLKIEGEKGEPRTQIWALPRARTCCHLPEGRDWEGTFSLICRHMGVYQSEGSENYLERLRRCTLGIILSPRKQLTVIGKKQCEKSKGIWNMLKAENREENWDCCSRQYHLQEYTYTSNI